MGENTKDPILQKIWWIRKRKGINQSEMAKRLQIEQTSYSAIERGENRMYADYLPIIAKALEINVWELFTNDEPDEIGPLNNQEKALILNFREIPSDEKKRVVEDAAQQFAEHKRPPVKE